MTSNNGEAFDTNRAADGDEENWADVTDDDDGENVKVGDAVSMAHKLDNPLAVDSLAHLENVPLKSGKTVSIKHFKFRQLPPKMFDWIMDLMTRNMKKMYRKSEGGWKFKDKKREMSEENSRYLVAFCENKPVAFSHFQFDMDYGREVLYCYELQVELAFRSCGLGKQFMEALEKIAKQANLPLVVLTVFKFNVAGLPFFKSIGYDTDETSPEDDEKKDYVILSKKVC